MLDYGEVGTFMNRRSGGVFSLQTGRIRFREQAHILRVRSSETGLIERECQWLDEICAL